MMDNKKREELKKNIIFRSNIEEPMRDIRNILCIQVEGGDCTGKETSTKRALNQLVEKKEELTRLITSINPKIKNIEIKRITFPDYSTEKGQKIYEFLRDPESRIQMKFNEKVLQKYLNLKTLTKAHRSAKCKYPYDWITCDFLKSYEYPELTFQQLVKEYIENYEGLITYMKHRNKLFADERIAKLNSIFDECDKNKDTFYVYIMDRGPLSIVNTYIDINIFIHKTAKRIKDYIYKMMITNMDVFEPAIEDAKKKLFNDIFALVDTNVFSPLAFEIIRSGLAYEMNTLKVPTYVDYTFILNSFASIDGLWTDMQDRFDIDRFERFDRLRKKLLKEKSDKDLNETEDNIRVVDIAYVASIGSYLPDGALVDELCSIERISGKGEYKTFDSEYKVDSSVTMLEPLNSEVNGDLIVIKTISMLIQKACVYNRSNIKKD